MPPALMCRERLVHCVVGGFKLRLRLCSLPCSTLTAVSQEDPDMDRHSCQVPPPPCAGLSPLLHLPRCVRL